MCDGAPRYKKSQIITVYNANVIIGTGDYCVKIGDCKVDKNFINHKRFVYLNSHIYIESWIELNWMEGIKKYYLMC